MRADIRNRTSGKTYSDTVLLWFIRSIYAVLLTRGIVGRCAYVSDPALRERLFPFFP